MPYVWMDEVPRVQTVGAGGIGVSPAIPVTEVDKISADGREVVKTAKENYIPNPGAASNGQVLKASSGTWAAGADSSTDSRLPNATGTDGQVLTVSSGAWVVADNVEGLPDATELVDDTTLLVADGAWTVSEQPEPDPDPDPDPDPVEAS